MINIYNVKQYCCDDISLIENYEKAISDETQTWDCHHRLETDLGLSKDELINRKIYLNVPAAQLIFLTHSEHQKIHNTGKHLQEDTRTNMSTAQKKRFEKQPQWNKGIPCTEESRVKNSATQKKRYEDPVVRQKYRDAAIGKNLNKRHMSNGIDHVFIKPEEIDHYLNLGYHFGMK